MVFRAKGTFQAFITNFDFTIIVLNVQCTKENEEHEVSKTWLKRIISSHLTNTLTSADLTFAH